MSVCTLCPIVLPPKQVAGPMWSGPIHDPTFVEKVLAHVEANPGNYGTSTRMKGMLTVAKEVRFLCFRSLFLIVRDILGQSGDWLFNTSYGRKLCSDFWLL